MTNKDELLKQLNVVAGVVIAAHETLNVAYMKLQKLKRRAPVWNTMDSICKAQVAVADVWDHLDGLIEQTKKDEDRQS